MKKIFESIGNFFFAVGAFAMNPFIMLPVLTWTYVGLDILKAVITDGYTADGYKYITLAALMVILVEVGEKSNVNNYYKDLLNRNKKK